MSQKHNLTAIIPPHHNSIIEIILDEIRFEDLEFVQDLGGGTYGKVCLYKHKTNRQNFYAVKFFYEIKAKGIKAETNYNKEVKIIRKKLISKSYMTGQLDIGDHTKIKKQAIIA